MNAAQDEYVERSGDGILEIGDRLASFADESEKQYEVTLDQCHAGFKNQCGATGGPQKLVLKLYELMIGTEFQDGLPKVSFK